MFRAALVEALGGAARCDQFVLLPSPQSRPPSSLSAFDAWTPVSMHALSPPPSSSSPVSAPSPTGVPAGVPLAQALLGEGTHGRVYHVQRLSDGKQLALKSIRLRSASTADERNACLREYEVMRAVHGKLVRGVVSAHDAWATHDSVYVLMDVCAGGTLADLVVRLRAMPGASAAAGECVRNALVARDNGETLLRLLCDIVAGCAELHQRNVAHLDMKPANVLLTADPLADDGRGGDAAQALVADFGLAQLACSENGTVGVKTSVGYTPLFAAPEVAQNMCSAEPSRVRTGINGRADMYGVGLILHELLYLQLPPALEDARQARLHPDTLTRRIAEGVLVAQPLRVPVEGLSSERHDALHYLLEMLLRRGITSSAAVGVTNTRPGARQVRDWLGTTGLWRSRPGLEAFDFRPPSMSDPRRPPM